jgi:Uma2 family endonuclease
MSPHPPQHVFDYSDYARFPDDGNRYEVLDGEVLVTPAPSPLHQHVLFTLAIALRQYVERWKLGVVLPDVDLLFQTGQFLRPDLLFVPENARPGITNRGIEEAPGLVVEVLSPTSRSIDQVKKPRRYGDFGIPEYWVVDPKARVVWVWRFASSDPGPERVTERLEWRPVMAGAAAGPIASAMDAPPPPLIIEVEDLFRPM